MKDLRIVSLESPYHSEDPATLNRNISYAIQASKHSLSLNKVPYPSHLIFTQLVHEDGSTGYVHDGVHDEFGGSRETVIAATHAIVVYRDFGISSGMQAAIDVAKECSIPIKYRSLPANYMTCVKITH